MGNHFLARRYYFCWKQHIAEPIFSSQKNNLFQHHDDLDHDYDHEAFLGEEQAHEFDDLTPEESQRRLGVIVDRCIYTNGNICHSFVFLLKSAE